MTDGGSVETPASSLTSSLVPILSLALHELVTLGTKMPTESTNSAMKLALAQSACVLLASSSLTVATWRFLQWRARKRAKVAADRAQGMVELGPLINAEDKNVCDHVVNSAIRRASKWISFQISAEDGSVMIGQVGGVSVHKRPLLTLEPDYIMKPVQTDHRGMREIFLYEAVKTLTKNRSLSQQYTSLLTGVPFKKLNNNTQSSIVQWGATNGIRITDIVDTLAMWVAMKMNDPVVAEHERTINKSWKVLKKERDTLRRLSTFIPAYYGVVGQRSPHSMPKGEIQAHKDAMEESGTNGDIDAMKASQFAMSLEAHLLLTDIRIGFRRPCVMDIKMGTQTYEPDCPPEKKSREFGKYPQQETFGFRIVGMRFYDPSHPKADKRGYRSFGKEYGRSLSTKEDLLKALRLFLSSGCAKKLDSHDEEPGADEHGSSRSADDTPEVDLHTSSSNMEENMTAQETIRLRASSSILAELRPIAGFFEENKSLCFYASSLLLVYEGDVNAPSPDVATVKMIDFGRVRRDPNGDQGYRTGLKTLKSLLDRIRKEEKRRLGHTMSILPSSSWSTNEKGDT